MPRVKTCQLQIKAAGPQDGTDDGTFEAIVATYDLDSYGDKIVPGAFRKTLAEWEAKGDPIPVIWSHMSFDPEAHIGVVEKAEEREGEGLWVKGRIDLDQPKAAQVYRLMKGRRVTQFSFAYDVEEGAWIEKGDEPPYYELRELKLYEVGPCLVGVNQGTELLAVKAADGRDLHLAVHGRTTPAEGDAIRLAVEAALGATAAKAGRVLSAKNETALTDALAQIKAGAKAVQGVLDQIKTSDDDDGKAAASPDRNDEKAKPSRSAVVEEPPEAKTDEPAAPRPASLRLSADLAAFAAEVDSATDE